MMELLQASILYQMELKFGLLLYLIDHTPVYISGQKGEHTRPEVKMDTTSQVE